MQTVFRSANDDYGKRQARLVSARAFVSERRRILLSDLYRTGGRITHLSDVNKYMHYHLHYDFYIHSSQSVLFLVFCAVSSLE